jgi:hypothetical protein
MTLVQQPIDLSSTPADRDHEVGVQRGGVSLELAHVAHPATLPARYIVLCQAGSVSDIPLSPAQAMPQRPQDPSDSLLVHERMLTTAASRSLISDAQTPGTDAQGRYPQARLDAMRETRPR